MTATPPREPHALIERMARAVFASRGHEMKWGDCAPLVRDALLADMQVALLALTPAGTGEGWQPIETARTDGTRIDLWVNFADEYQHRVTDAYFGRPHHTCGEAGRYCDSCPPDRDVWCDEFGAIDGTPTHWMPLPEGPKP